MERHRWTSGPTVQRGDNTNLTSVNVRTPQRETSDSANYELVPGRHRQRQEVNKCPTLKQETIKTNMSFLDGGVA